MTGPENGSIDPLRFAEEWVAAWNAQDLARVLEHYAPGVEFHSPIAREVTGEGRVSGKAALEAYWQKALARVPELQFELEHVLEGADALTIVYRNHRAQRVAETCEFDARGQVIRSYACYASLA